MPLFMRRRPLLRAAAVAGGAYYAGSRHAEGQAQAASQDQRISELESQQAAPAASGDGGISSGAMQKLQELGQLHVQGVLTDDEFATQKARLLAS